MNHYTTHPKIIKFVRIFLLILIVIGIGLLGTQKYWVPKVVEKIMEHEKMPKIIRVYDTPISTRY